jgi:hypothetical protein
MENITNVTLHNTQTKQVFYGDKIKDTVIGRVCSRQEEKYVSVTFLGTDKGKGPSFRRRRRRKFYIKMYLKKWSARQRNGFNWIML